MCVWGGVCVGCEVCMGVWCVCVCVQCVGCVWGGVCVVCEVCMGVWCVRVCVHALYVRDSVYCVISSRGPSRRLLQRLFRVCL